MEAWLYNGMRCLHLLAFAAFFGSALAVLAVKYFIERTGDVRSLDAGLKALVRVDNLVTGPSAVVVLATGLSLLFTHPSLAKTGWAISLLVLWVIGAAIAHLVSIPLLRKLSGYTSKHLWLESDYYKMSRRWDASSVALLLLLVGATAVAIFKPFS